MKNNKKSVSQMAFIIVSFVIALLFLAVMSYISGGIIKSFLKSIGVIQDKVDEDASNLDITGGIRGQDAGRDSEVRSRDTLNDEDPPT